MSRTLQFELPEYDLAQLTSELLAAVPGLAPVLDPSLPVPGATRAVLSVEGLDGMVVLTTPDDADETAITAVIDRHRPGSPATFASREQEETAARVARAGEAASTADLLKLMGA